MESCSFVWVKMNSPVEGNDWFATLVVEEESSDALKFMSVRTRKFIRMQIIQVNEIIQWREWIKVNLLFEWIEGWCSSGGGTGKEERDRSLFVSSWLDGNACLLVLSHSIRCNMLCTFDSRPSSCIFRYLSFFASWIAAFAKCSWTELSLHTISFTFTSRFCRISVSMRLRSSWGKSKLFGSSNWHFSLPSIGFLDDLGRGVLGSIAKIQNSDCEENGSDESCNDCKKEVKRAFITQTRKENLCYILLAGVRNTRFCFSTSKYYVHETDMKQVFKKNSVQKRLNTLKALQGIVRRRVSAILYCMILQRLADCNFFTSAIGKLMNLLPYSYCKPILKFWGIRRKIFDCQYLFFPETEIKIISFT